MSNRFRVVATVAAAVILGGVLVGCGGGSGTPTSTPTSTPSPSPTAAATSQPAAAPGADRIELLVKGGAVVGGVQRFPITRGKTVALVVSSDVADEVHLHGYDRKVNVPAGGKATLSFVADVPGVFEVELEQRKIQIAQLEVR